MSYSLSSNPLEDSYALMMQEDKELSSSKEVNLWKRSLS